MTDEERFTPEGLPIVQEGIAEVILRDESMGSAINNPIEFWRLIGSKDLQYVKECHTIMEDARKSGFSADDLALMSLGFAYGYEILRRQGESYQIERA